MYVATKSLLLTMSTETTKDEQKPLRIAYYLIKYPCRIIALIVILFFLTCGADYLGFGWVSSTDHSYLVMDDLNVNRKDAIDLALINLGQQSASIEPKTTEIGDYTLLMMYKTRDHSNLLTPSNITDYIQYINMTNNKIPYSNPSEYYSLCLADPTDEYSTYPDCASSAIYDPITAYFHNLQQITQSDIDDFIDSNLNNSFVKSSFLACFEEDFENTRSSSYYRSFYRFGLPYPDIDDVTSSYVDARDNKVEQEQFYADYIFPIYTDIQIEDERHPNIETVILGETVRSLQRQVLTNDGIIFSVGSIMTVFLIMCWHLNSLFLAFSAMTQIIFSFPFAYFIYRYLFQVTFFDTLNTLVIFLILGIGADDVFVFVDAWVQSAHFVANPNDLILRMSFAYRRASKAMIVTTATTFFAFMATAFSPIMPIAAFGIWAACVVVMNYVLVITLCPALLSFWYQTVRPCEHWPSCCYKLKKIICCSKQDNETEAEVNKNANDLKSETPSTAISEAQSPEIKHTSNDTPTSETSKDSNSKPDYTGTHSKLSAKEAEDENEEKARCLERFLGTTFANIIIKLRIFILIFIAILVGVSAWKASQISPLTKQEQWFAEDHYMEKMFSWQKYFTGGSVTELIETRIIWGIEEKVDRTGVTFWDTEDYGQPVYDSAFDASSYDAQEHLLNVCDLLMANYSDMLYDTNDYFDCWIHDFISYGETQFGYSYPFIFDSNDDALQRDSFNEFVYNWTLYDDVGKKRAANGKVGVIDGELTFTFVEFTIPHSRWLTLEEKRQIFEDWEDVIFELNTMAPEGVNRAYQSSAFAWAWMASEQGFVTSALQGIAIAMPLALLCLILSTQNWILSIFATSAILGIISCEVALMVLQGWELGISECIAIVMMIGFSVDYVVHLANAYQECEESEMRNDKLKFALYTMGISVVSGALTTFGSGFWLIFPEMIFFNKFGLLVMTVVSFSLLFSLVYFVALLATFGPQGETGNIAIDKVVGFVCKPFSGCWCSCCRVICCCIGTMDDYKTESQQANEDENKNDDNEEEKKKKAEMELMVPMSLTAVASGSEVSENETPDVEREKDESESKKDGDVEDDEEP